MRTLIGALLLILGVCWGSTGAFVLLQLLEGWLTNGGELISTSFMVRPVSPAAAMAVSLIPAVALILAGILLIIRGAKHSA